tara:strand:- start:127 stop:588 length:462 start_codon:yes stop_codon:yes gene_type:complete
MKSLIKEIRKKIKMANILTTILVNKVFLTVIITWAIGQVIKVGLDWYHKKQITFKNFVELGGFPSTHATVVSALTAAVYLDQGITTLFIVTLIMSVIVMRDAVGVRLEVENHAKLLNKKFKSALNENVGHSLKEVIAGVVFGIIITYVLWGLI